MHDATDEIIHILSERGYRVTKARKEVIAKLSLLRQPVTIQELAKKLGAIDAASVYRTVRMLLEEGFLEEIRVANALPKYALAHGHHHHVVCTSCGLMEHIACTNLQQSVPSSFDTITAHEVTLYGMCKKCA